jgi:hypothetical protein
MLWYKSWLETRWRFIVPLLIVVCSTGGLILLYPRFLEAYGEATSE